MLEAYHLTSNHGFFRESLKRLNQRELKLYYLYREGTRKRIYPEVPEKYMYLLIFDLINLNYITDPNKAILEILSLYHQGIPVHSRLNNLFPYWMGDMYLCMNRSFEAFQWYLLTGDEFLYNLILSYFNYDRRMDKIPSSFWKQIIDKKEVEEEVYKGFLSLLTYINIRLIEDINKDLLDYINLRPSKGVTYELFREGLYGGQRIYKIDHFKKFLPSKRLEILLKEIFVLSTWKEGTVRKYRKDLLSKRIRSYLAEYNIITIVQENKKRRPQKRIYLDTEKIATIMKEQRDTNHALITLTKTTKETSKDNRKPIKDLHDLFQIPKEENLKEVNLSNREKILLKNLLPGGLEEKRLKEALGFGVFMKSIINDVNEKFYPVLGDYLLEKEGETWFIQEEHKSNVLGWMER